MFHFDNTLALVSVFDYLLTELKFKSRQNELVVITNSNVLTVGVSIDFS